MKVAVVRATPSDVEGAVREAMDLIDYRPARDEIFLKPNQVTDAPQGRTGVVTSLELLGALVRIFGGHRVVIGEGSCAGLDTGEVLRTNGVEALARASGAAVANLDQCVRETFPWRQGSLELPAMLRTHALVNVPVMKTHGLTGVSLGVKNLKGLLTQPDKKRFHLSLDLDSSIRDLGLCVRPELTIIDGITALEGNGPGHWGNPKPMNLLVMGTDVFAVDAVACYIMEFDAECIRHLRRLDPSQIQVVGLDPQKVRSKFERPMDANEFTFGVLRVHNLRRACSACLLSLERGLEHAMKHHKRLMKAANKRYGTGQVSILLGRGAKIPTRAARVVCYGNCAVPAGRGSDFILIEGCPPGPEDYAQIYQEP